MNKNLTTLKISKKETEQFEKIKELLLSKDYETAYLGYKMFVNTSLYKKGKPKSLVPFLAPNDSLFKAIMFLKWAILKYGSTMTESQVYYIYDKYINNLNNLCRLSPVKILIPEEKDIFREIYENLSTTESEDLIRISKKKFLESRTIRNNRNKLFKYNSSLIPLNAICRYLDYNMQDKLLATTRVVLLFLNYLIYDNAEIYEKIPINVIIEE